MLCKRIIPCLDVKDGKVVKGKNFSALKEVSEPQDLAKFYSDCGADELVFYDITASLENRHLFTDILKKTCKNVFIPITVGGGVNSVADFERLLSCGADKVSVNSGAIQNPSIIEEAAKVFGSQCVVLSVDAKREDGKFKVFSHGGRYETSLLLEDWVKYGEDHGAGEIVLNSIDTDGVKDGFDIPMLKSISFLSIPVIASGGAGKISHFTELFQSVDVDAALGASVFHFGEIDIKHLKQNLIKSGIEVRL